MPASFAPATGAAVGTATAAWFFVLSGYLGATPTEPVGRRVDAFFQCDAARHVDAAHEFSRQYGSSHPLLRYLYAYPLHRLTRAVAPGEGGRPFAVYACRAYVAAAAGFGIGCLVAALVRFGVRPVTVLSLAPVLMFGSGQAVTCLPDHYGISFGVLAWAFAVYLNGERGGRFTAAKLLLLSAVAGGVTLTNAALPLLLLAARWAGRVSIPARAWAAGALLAAGGAAGGLAVLKANADAMPWHVRTFLNWRLLDDPGAAAARAARGLVNVAVGPAPAIDTNNLPETPMLTYEPRWGVYAAWPYDRVQSVSAAAWVLLLALAVAGRTWRERTAAVPLAAWVGWNLLFHNVWGDEFFLYTSHYSWAVWAVAVVGWKDRPAFWLPPLVAAVAVGQVYTLWQFRRALSELPY